MSAEVLAELVRVKAIFQQRAICAVIGIPTPRLRQMGEQQSADHDTPLDGSIAQTGAVVSIHNDGDRA